MKTLPKQLETKRLILRRWKESDFEPFARLNADKRVMEYFPQRLSEEQTKNLIDFIETSFDKHDMGLWAVEVKGTGDFVGFVGLWKPTFESKFTPCVEVGWRLLYEHWGNGYAPEAGLASLADGFDRLGLSQIVSFTSIHNKKSIRVMEKLGLSFQEEFDHPSIADGHILKRHVIYTISKTEWENNSNNR